VKLQDREAGIVAPPDLLIQPVELIRVIVSAKETSTGL
jgi:hypothetical protein